MTYKASLDKLAVGVTIFTIVSFSALPFFFAFAVPDSTALTVTILAGLTLVICWAYHPINYSVNGNNLIIHRPIKDLVIDVKKIEEVREIPTSDISYSIRTFGVGGLFGYFGLFANRKLGNMTWYATRRDHPVLVKTKKKKLIITPDFPRSFVNELITIQN
jgi:hypothetical protein